MNRPEILAPAGTMEKAHVALAYGADALYLAGQRFGMRASAGNFTNQELTEIINYAHSLDRRVYVTVNVFPHNHDLDGLPEYLVMLGQIGVDAIILADVGVLRLARQMVPHVPVHLSTQANTVNYQAARFWSELGITRLVMARELSREEIARIVEETSCEIEVFVHGAMCMAYSGRCLLSHYLTGRDANRGACAQSCRWSYAVVEQTRSGEYFPIEEESEGTYIFNSQDLSLIEYLPDLVGIGVDSLKIEGRMKSAYYVATVVRAYRQALDAWIAHESGEFSVDPTLLEELEKVSHRPYYTGFFLGNAPGTYLEEATYRTTYEFVGVVEDYDRQTNRALVGVRNRLRTGDEVEIMQPQAENLRLTVGELVAWGSKHSMHEVHANSRVWMPSPPVKPWSMLRVQK